MFRKPSAGGHGFGTVPAASSGGSGLGTGGIASGFVSAGTVGAGGIDRGIVLPSHGQSDSTIHRARIGHRGHGPPASAGRDLSNK